MKTILKLGLLTLFVLATTFLVTTSPAVAGPGICLLPPSAMTGWWPGDGDVLDIVNGNHGALGAGALYGDGYVDQAFSLDGLQDYVTVPDASTPELDGFTELTIDAWIYPLDQLWQERGTGRFINAIVSKYDTRLETGASYYLALENEHLLMGVFQTVRPSVSFAGIQAIHPVQPHAWSHVAGTWKGGNDLELYVNGVPVQGNIWYEGSIPSSMANSNVPVNFGRFESFSGSFTGPAGFFHGLIDEVEIFNRALSASEIQDIYSAGSDGKCKVIPIPVVVDIKPDSIANNVNVKSEGVIPVAILTIESFDVSAVDPASIRFGPDGAEESHGHGLLEDVDEDGDLDLLLHFPTQDTGIECGDTHASLSGVTFSGIPIEGSDSIRTKGCK